MLGKDGGGVCYRTDNLPYLGIWEGLGEAMEVGSTTGRNWSFIHEKEEKRD